MEGKSVGEVTVPTVFQSPIRPDLIRRAVVAIQSHMYQPQGRDPMAGKRTTAQSIGVGHGMSRVPRVKGERYPRGNMAAFAPSTVKGRLNFPPTPNKQLRKKINRKELERAFNSAVAATSSKELVKSRGHQIADEKEFPLVVSDELEKITKSSDAQKILTKLGIWVDVERASKRKIRGGKGKMRGRTFKHRISSLIVVEKKQGAEKAFRNIPGVEVVDVASLNVNNLAPGTHAGRLTIWTRAALKGVENRQGERS